MKTRLLRDIEVSAVGIGCMGFHHGYGPVPDHEEAVRLIRYAVELGCTHFDTAEGYGRGHNALLVGEALRPVRDQVVIATKLHVNQSTSDNPIEKQVREHLEASLRRLGTGHVELYYLHRINPAVPVEDVAQPMGKLIREGKIRGWGQSQSTPDQIRRAHAITPLSAIQSEYSIMERMFETDVLPLCQELNIGFVSFSPLASGFLSGKVRPGDKYQGDDVRRVITRSPSRTCKQINRLSRCCNGLLKRKAPRLRSLAGMDAGEMAVCHPDPPYDRTDRGEPRRSGRRTRARRAGRTGTGISQNPDPWKSDRPRYHEAS